MPRQRDLFSKSLFGSSTRGWPRSRFNDDVDRNGLISRFSDPKKVAGNILKHPVPGVRVQFAGSNQINTQVNHFPRQYNLGQGNGLGAIHDFTIDEDQAIFLSPGAGTYIHDLPNLGEVFAWFKHSMITNSEMFDELCLVGARRCGADRVCRHECVGRWWVGWGGG